jgi:hypothetical protein
MTTTIETAPNTPLTTALSESAERTPPAPAHGVSAATVSAVAGLALLAAVLTLFIW